MAASVRSYLSYNSPSRSELNKLGLTSQALKQGMKQLRFVSDMLNSVIFVCFKTTSLASPHRGFIGIKVSLAMSEFRH